MTAFDIVQAMPPDGVSRFLDTLARSPTVAWLAARDRADRRAARWRAASDKMGFEHTTPTHRRRRESVGGAQKARECDRRRLGIPERRKPVRAASTRHVREMVERGREVSRVSARGSRGYHSLRRQFATELKDTPLRDLAHLGGWKGRTTLLTCYLQPDEATQRRALESRRTLKASGIE